MLIFKLSVFPTPSKEQVKPVMVLVIISQGKMEFGVLRRYYHIQPCTLARSVLVTQTSWTRDVGSWDLNQTYPYLRPCRRRCGYSIVGILFSILLQYNHLTVAIPVVAQLTSDHT